MNPKMQNLLQSFNSLYDEIIKELSTLCSDKGVTCSSKILTFLVNLLSLDPGYHLKAKSITRADIEKVISKCFQLAAGLHTPQMITIQMQIMFIENFITHLTVMDKHRQAMELKTSHITQEIFEFEAKNKDDTERLRKLIALDVILNTGDLDNPVNDKSVEDTVTAINSVMSETDLIKFCKLNYSAKLESLQEIREIVCGIRIFNEDAGVSNLAIPNLPKTLLQSFDSTQSVLQIALTEVMDNVNLLTSALAACGSINAKDKLFVLSYPENVTPDNLDYIKDLLIMYRQHEQILRKLIDDMPTVKKEIEKSIRSHKERLIQLHRVLEYRTAVATEKVFPKFIKLFQTWKCLQNFIYVLSEINLLNNELLKLTDSIPTFDLIALKMLKTDSIETDEERMQRCSSKKVKASCAEDCEVVDIDCNTAMEYLGFCAYTLCEGHGILMPGNPEIGLCKRNNKCYAFMSAEAAELYMELPKRFEFSMVQLAREKLQLTGLLDLFEIIEAAQYRVADMAQLPDFAVGKCEAEVQTETHPIPYYQCKDYTWNVWELRRKAIQLANLAERRTHSAQTTMTYAKTAEDTQTYGPAEKPAQTKKETHTNVPKPSKVLTKTRGVSAITSRSKPKHLDLTVHGMDLCRSLNITDKLNKM